jgi:hypothetical protein
MRRTILLLATMPLTLLLALALVGCSLGGGGTTASQKKPPEGTFELPNGHSLYMECRGSGSPTIVLEVGNRRTSKRHVLRAGYSCPQIYDVHL